MLGQAAQATISYLKLPQGNSCFPDALLPDTYVIPMASTTVYDTMAPMRISRVC